jgi:hypothetical protein
MSGAFLSQNPKSERRAKLYPVPTALFQRSVKADGRRAHEMKHRYREALFGQTLFEISLFEVAQFGFE